MNEYELLQEENQRFWKSFDIDSETLNAQNLALLVKEESSAKELELEVL